MYSSGIIVDDDVVGRLGELEVLLPGAFNVHNVHRVVVRLNMFVSLVLAVRFSVQEADEREVNCLFVLIEAAWFEPFVFDGFFEFCVTVTMELLRILRQEIRVNLCS